MSVDASATATPGPWSCRADPYEDGTPYFWFTGGEPDGEVHEGFRFSAIMSVADAALIASAPALYAALQAAERELAQVIDDYENALVNSGISCSEAVRCSAAAMTALDAARTALALAHGAGTDGEAGR